MVSRIYTSVVTIGDIEVYNVTSNPDGALGARIGSVAIRSDAGNVAMWQNVDGSTSWTAIVGASSPGGTISVAQAGGGDYTTIGAALAVALSGDVVSVYPGTYAENIVIPAGVVVQGATAQVPTVISGADTTGVRVTLTGGGAPSSLRNVTVIGPSAGANPAVDATGLGGGAGAGALFDLLLQGGGGTSTGAGILGAGTGQLIVQNLQVLSSGAFGGPLIDINSGTLILRGLNLISGTAPDIIRATGASTVRGNGIVVGTGWVSTDAFDVGGTSSWQIDSVLIPEGGSQVTNSIHIVADGVSFDISSAHLHATTWDILVDPALVGTGTVFNFSSGDYKRARTSIPVAWSPDLFIAGYTDTSTDSDNPGNKFEGNVDVGSRQFPASASFGDGDSSVLGMRAFTYDDSAGTYVDVTDNLKSPSGSIVTWSTDQDDGLMIYTPYRPKMFDIENVVAAVAGAGDLSLEVVTGTGPLTTAVIKYMAAKSDGTVQYAKTLLKRADGDENVRLNWDEAPWTTWPLTDPASTGAAGYVLYIRNLGGALTTSPTIERVKLGDSYIEDKRTGAQTFGEAQPLVELLAFTGETWSEPAGGASSPASADVTISANVSYRQVRSLFAAGSDGRSAGTQIQLPFGIDTSRPAQFVFTVYTDGTSTNVVQNNLYVTEAPASGGTTEKLYGANFTPSGVADFAGRVTYIVSGIDISNLVPGDTIAFSLNPLRATDTNPDDLIVLNGQIDAREWRG